MYEAETELLNLRLQQTNVRKDEWRASKPVHRRFCPTARQLPSPTVIIFHIQTRRLPRLLFTHPFWVLLRRANPFTLWWWLHDTHIFISILLLLLSVPVFKVQIPMVLQAGETRGWRVIQPHRRHSLEICAGKRVRGRSARMTLGRRIVIRAVHLRAARVVIAHESRDEPSPAGRLATHVSGHACVAFLATHLVHVARCDNCPV